MNDVIQLYPPLDSPLQAQQALNGLYLGLNLHRQADVGNVLIYANYIASLDGRIAVHDANRNEFVVPPSIANPRDWRLYQELAAQADVMLTSARYFRQLAKGDAQDLLPVGREAAYADLGRWRLEQGMEPQPDVVVFSNSLDIPAAALENVQDRRVLIGTSERAEDAQVSRLEALGCRVVLVGAERVEGILLKRYLAEHGYRSAYMIAGPAVHRTLLADGVLDDLFLTTHLSVLGGSQMHTMLSGHLDQPAQMTLQRLYLDQHRASGQLFAHYTIQQETTP